MKRILILLLVAAGFTANAQSYTGDFLNARKRLTVRGSNIDTIKNDTTGLAGRTKTLMTADAVYKFVNGRTLGGGGGSQDLQTTTDNGNTTTNWAQFGDSLVVEGADPQFHLYGSGFGYKLKANSTDKSLQFINGSNSKVNFIIDENGLVGINTLGPSAQLDVQDANGAIATGIFNAHEDRSGEIVNIQQAGTKKFSFNTTGAIEITEVAAPATPASGYGAIYAKTDGKIYFKNDGGTEYDLTGGGGSNDSTVVRNQRWKFRNTFELMDEFLGNGIAPGWSSQSSGSGAEAATSTYLFADLDSTWQGATYAITGTTTTGKASAIYGNATSSNTGSLRGINTKKAVFETRVRFDTLSNATNEYTALLGYTDWLGSGFYQSGVKFVYDRATYGDYWVLRADDGGTSAVVTTTAVAAKTNYILRIEIDNWQMGSSGGNVKAYINDVEVVASSGTYPIVSNINNSLSFYPTYWIQKTAGTTNRKLHVDWVYQYYEFITRK